MGVTFVAIAAIAFWLVASMPPALASVSDKQANLDPQTPLTVSVSDLGGSIQQLTMTEAFYDIDGNLGPSHEVPVRLVPVGASASASWRTDYRVERADGSPLLNYDGLYRLGIVAGSATASLVGKGTVSQHTEFTSLPSPRLRVPATPVQLNYQAPAQLNWNRAIESFKVETVPALDVQTRIDPANPEVSYVDLVGARPDTQYQLRIVDAVAVGGGKLVAPATMTVVTPAPPAVLVDKVKLEDGYRISVPWDRAIKSMDYEITPAVNSTVSIDSSNPAQTAIVLNNPKQGQEYTLRIKGALATTNAPLTQPREVKLKTPDPLKISKFDPADQPQYGVPLGAGLTVTFDKPVKDRAAAEQAIKITPAVPGKFVWKSDTQVQFAPNGNLPAATDFTVSVLGGRSGVHGQDGGYLDQTAQFAFWTALAKEIEVNLTDQTLTLWQGGVPVYDTLVSTGVRGAETPTGRYEVQYKMTATRMKGTNPSGHTYDLPDVPWVLPFMGDYTLHGAYWRDTYGVPQSNGCVSMPVPVAKKVYDWADVGTAIRIHY